MTATGAFSPDGTRFTIEKSSQEVAEIKPPPVIKLGTQAIAFTAKTTDGQEVNFPSSYKGKLVLLDFWATWCGPCREAIPHLIQLYKAYRENGFEVIGMSLDKGDGEVVRNFAKSMDIPYPIVMAPEEVVRNYRVTSIPTTFILDKEGKIQQRITGFNSAFSLQMNSLVIDLTSKK